MGGCVGDEIKHRKSHPENQIIVIVRKIKFTFELQQQKRKQEFKQQQALLLEHFQKPTKVRSQKTEQALINRTVYYDNITKIYFICEIEANIIIDNKDSLQNNVNFVRASFNTLLYCASILKEPLLFQLTDAIKKYYPDFKEPQENQVRHELVKLHKKTDSVPFEMENQYVMAFSNNYGMTMAQICEVGHRYAYGQ